MAHPHASESSTQPSELGLASAGGGSASLPKRRTVAWVRALVAVAPLLVGVSTGHAESAPSPCLVRGSVWPVGEVPAGLLEFEFTRPESALGAPASPPSAPVLRRSSDGMEVPFALGGEQLDADDEVVFARMVLQEPLAEGDYTVEWYDCWGQTTRNTIRAVSTPPFPEVFGSVRVDNVRPEPDDPDHRSTVRVSLAIDRDAVGAWYEAAKLRWQDASSSADTLRDGAAGSYRDVPCGTTLEGSVTAHHAEEQLGEIVFSLPVECPPIDPDAGSPMDAGPSAMPDAAMRDAAATPSAAARSHCSASLGSAQAPDAMGWVLLLSAGALARRRRRPLDD